MRRWLHSYPVLLVRRLALLYLVLALCRAVFYLYNRSLIDPLAWEQTGVLLTGALRFDTVSVLYANAVFILLSLIPLPVRERRWWRNLQFGYYLTANSLLVVGLNLADTVYFHYAQKRITSDEFLFADNSNSLQLVLKFAAENWYIVLLGAAMIALLAIGYGRKIRAERVFARKWISCIADTLLLALAAGLTLAGVRGGMTRATRPITLSDASLYAASSQQANLILSNPFCLLRTAGSKGVRPVRFFPQEQADSLFTPVHRPAALAVDLSGRNVVVFIMESMSAEHSAHLRADLHGERGGYTPFLDSLMRDGLCFTRMYANGTRSIQALPAVLGSIPSFRQPFVLMPQSLGQSRQLPAILADEGYTTAFFCGSEHGSMGFGAYARSAGVQRLVSREDYEARHGRNDFDGYWGIWDAPFLQFAGEEMGGFDEPFFAALFTLSSHHPFVVPEQLRDSLPAGTTPIHRPAAYTDLAFRRFFERFGDEEWFRRTIFVFVADHVSSEKMAPDTREFPGNHHIVSLIWSADGGEGSLKGQYDRIVQQIDLMPTLLGVLGNDQPYFAYGRDIFNEPERSAWAIAYTSRYEALTEEGILHLDEEGNTQWQPRACRQTAPDSLAGTERARDTFRRADADAAGNRLKALIQHYYDRIIAKNYTVEDQPTHD